MRGSSALDFLVILDSPMHIVRRMTIIFCKKITREVCAIQPDGLRKWLV